MCLILEISVVAVESALCQCIASTKASTSIIVCAHVEEEEEEDRVTSSHISKKLVHLINSPPFQTGVQEANGNRTLQLKNSS